MMEIYEGRIGSGKTYNAVRRALEYLGNGGTVCGNMFLKFDACADFCRSVYGVEIQRDQIIELFPEQIPSFHQHVPQGTRDCPTLVFLDECQIWFNALDHRDTDRELLEFLTQSRRASIDVIFISQHADNINKQFRRLVSSYHIFRDLQAGRLPGVPFKYPFPHFLEKVFDYDRKSKIDHVFQTKDKRIFAAYDSFGWQRKLPLLEAKQRAKLQHAKGSKWKPLAMAALLIALALAGGCYADKQNTEKELSETLKAVKAMAEAVALSQAAASKSSSAVSPAATGSPAASTPDNTPDWVFVKTTYMTNKGWIHDRADGFRIYRGCDLPEGKVLLVSDGGYVVDYGRGFQRVVRCIPMNQDFKPLEPAREDRKDSRPITRIASLP